ncbi:hypothetical protein Tco_1530212 [Tanacetum coccineum]
MPGPESIKNQESEKSPKEIIKIKREQGEEKQDSTYSIRSIDKVALEEFDLKSALFKHMNKYKTANRNPANYHLYHALMEALIADEYAMDKVVKERVKDHKRKHDSDNDEDDDDDKGPSAGSNQGKSAKRIRHDLGASGSAQPPLKDDEQSSKKPHDSDASASKQHPSLTSTGWQITDTRDVVIDSSMHRSEPESGHSEHSSDDVSKQDEGHVSDLEDTDNAHIPKVTAATWFKPIPEDERPATPEPEWTIPPNDFPKPENNWENAYATTRTGKKKLCKVDLEGPAFNLVDLVNPEGHQILRNIYELLPLGGLPGQDIPQDVTFVSRVLPYKLGLKVSNLDLLGLIEDEELFGKLVDDDAVRVCLLLALEVIFIGKKLVDEVPDTLMCLVENLVVWNDFRWGEYIWRHLYDQIMNVVNKNKWEHLKGLSKSWNYVPTYTLFGFVWSFKIWILESFEGSLIWWNRDPEIIPRGLAWSRKQLFKRSDYSLLFGKDSRVNLDLTPMISEQQTFWYMAFRKFYMSYIPRSPPTTYTDLFDDYMKKLSSSRKRGKINTRDLPIIHRCDTTSVEEIRLKDGVIAKLNSRVFKLDAIIKVLGRERNGVSLEYLIQEESRLKQEEEEMCRLEEHKMMKALFLKTLQEEVQRCDEKEKMLKYEEEKKKRRHELMNSDHWKLSVSKISNGKRTQRSSAFSAYY